MNRRQRVGNGLGEVGLLAALTIIVLPCCFFTLLALLDRFERNLDPDAQTPPTLVVKPAPAAAESDPMDYESAGADVLSLPVAVTVAEAPAAATG
jgi:hypothetical protein